MSLQERIETLSSFRKNNKRILVTYGRALAEFVIDKVQLTQNSVEIAKGQTLDVDFLMECVFSPYHFIEAAGGLVVNKDKEMLFIFRRNKWDLPKGKMEAGETPEICAEREIEEETGVNHLQLIHKIIDTYHIYEERGQQILKKTYWFYFTTNFEGTPKPQIEEDISSISWIGKENLAMPLSNTSKCSGKEIAD
jgi:8-oxo-dGTP pyrophosphatase MutT (NUDIX family)